MAIRGVLLDLGGVVYQGREALPGAIEAVERLKDADLSVRFLTNTTRRPRKALLEMLTGLGLAVAEDELFMPALAARDLLIEKGRRGHLLIHPKLKEDFAGLPESGEISVVVGDAGRGFTYDALNAAFRELIGGADLIALAKNRSFKDDDDELSMDTGAFVTALEYASGKEALVLGKPAEAFFQAALTSMDCAPGDAVMVGDDVEPLACAACWFKPASTGRTTKGRSRRRRTRWRGTCPRLWIGFCAKRD